MFIDAAYFCDVEASDFRLGSLADAALMSALSLVHPDKRTSAHVSGASARCQKRTSVFCRKGRALGVVLQTISREDRISVAR
jgi:hypothetical protein